MIEKEEQHSLDDGDLNINPQSIQTPKIKGSETVYSGTVNMVKAFIGLGILALPSGFSSSGWLGGLLFFIICGSFIMYLSLKLIDVADKKESNARNITEFSVECLGQKFELWVNCFLFTIQAGVCVTYVIFFSTYFKESLCFFTDYDRKNPLCESRLFSILLSFILVGPSIFIRNISKLKDWSLFANGLILVSLIIILVSCVFKMNTSYIESDNIQAIRWTSIGKAVGVFVFAFEGATLFFEVRSSMKDQREFKQVLRYSLSGGMLAYAVIGLTGYLAFGSKVQDVILFNFPMDNPIYVFIQIFYCIAILLSYPLQMFPIVSVIEVKIIEGLKMKMKCCNPEKKQVGKDTEEISYQNEGQDKVIVDEKEELNRGDQSIKETKENQEQLLIQQQENHLYQDEQHDEKISNNDNSHNISYEEDEINVELSTLDIKTQKQFKTQSMIIRVISLLVVFLIATMFNRLTVFLNLIGSIAGTFFCFILPVVIYEKNMPNVSENVVLFHRAIMLLGIIFGIIGIVSTFDSIF